MRKGRPSPTVTAKGHGGVRRARLKVIAWGIAASMVGGMAIVTSAATPAEAAPLAVCNGSSASDQNSLRVTPSHGAVFYIDSGQGQALDAAYAAYRITNLDGTSARDNLWVKYDSFTGGVVGLANPSDAIQPIGDLTASGSASSFALLKAITSTKLAQSHVVHVYQGRPGTAGAVELYACTYTFAKVAETIKAAANKVTSPPSVTTVATIGSTMTVTIQGNTGTIGAGSSPDGSMMWFTPAARSSWPTQALRLETTSIGLYSNNSRNAGSLVGTYTNQLRIPTTSGSKFYYTAVYTFRIVGTSPTPASVVPIAQISSGTQIKHTDLASISSTTLSTNTPAVDVAVTKSTASTVTIADGRTTFSYTVTLTNSGAAVTLDSLTDTRSAGLDFTSGSASFAGSTIADPTAITGDQNSLLFPGPFALPAGTVGTPSVRTVTYKMSAETCLGSFAYTNSAVAGIGSVVIGSNSSSVSVSQASGECGATTITTSTENQTIAISAVTSPATALGTTTARLNGLVDPNSTSGQPITFTYGTSPSLAGATTVSVGTTTTASTPYAVLADLTGLTTGTLYFFRVSAGTVDGEILSFVTTEPVGTPTVTTLQPTGVTTAGVVTFNGTIDPNLVANGAKVRFQYALDSSGGACTSLGAITTTGFAQSETDTGTTDAIYTGSFPSDVSISVTGLTSGARYCYRTVGYYDASTASWSLSVAGDTWVPVLVTTKTAQAITFTAPADGTVGQTVAGGATASSGLTVQYTSNTPEVCTVSGGGVITLLSSGICSITADQPGSDTSSAAESVTVNFAVAKAPQTIDFAVVAAVGSGETAALTATSTSGLSVTYTAGPSDVCRVDGDHIATGPGVGTCTVVASQPGNDSYFSADDVTRTFEVQPAPPNITTTALAPGDIGTPYEVTLDAAGGNGVFTGGWRLTAGTLPAGLSFDEATGTISGTPEATGEFTLSFTVTDTATVPQTSATRQLVLTITKPAPVITATDITFDYGDPDRTTGASTTSGGSIRYEIADEGVVVESSGELRVVSVGTTTMLVVSEETELYAATSVTVTVTVTPATLVVNAPSPSVTYGDAPPVYPPAYSGFVLDEDETQLSSAATCSSSYTHTSAAGSEPAVICLGAAADNYEVVYVDGVVNIAKAPQQITLNPDEPGEMPPGSSQGFVPSALGGVVPSVTVDGDCTWSDGILTAGVTEGECTMSVSAAESENYLAAGPVTRTVTVVATALVPRTLVLELDVPGAEHTIFEELSLVTTVGPVYADTVWRVDAASVDICRLENDGSITLLAVGECTIHASVAAVATYSDAKATLTFTIVRAPRVLDLGISRATTQPGNTARATAVPSAGGGTITYRLLGGASHCVIDDDVITAVSTGTCDVVAAITHDDRYESATSAAVRLEVVVAPLDPGPTPTPTPAPDPAPSRGPAPSASPSPQPIPESDAVAGGDPAEELVIRPLGRLPMPSPAADGSGGTVSSASTIDVGRGIQPGGSAGNLSSVVRSPAELAAERLSGFAPRAAVSLQATGTRTVAQFAVEPAGLDQFSLRAAISESRDRLGADFARLDSAVVGRTPVSQQVLGGVVSDDAQRVFLDSGLEDPMLVGDLPTEDSDSWLMLSGSVDGYVPGSVVYLATTTQPIIFAASVVERDGTAELTGALPVDLLPTGGHNIRIVGTRALEGGMADADGAVRLSAEAVIDIEQFDPGTQATVRIEGSNASDGTHVAQRIVPLGQEAPWWSVIALALVALAALALLLWRRPEQVRWGVLAAVVIAVTSMVPVAAGWLSRFYDVSVVGLLIGFVAAVLVISIPLITRRVVRRDERRARPAFA